MERKKYIKGVILATLLPLCTVFPESQIRDQIYQAFINGDMKQWYASMIQLAEEPPSTIDQHVELLSYYYGYTAWLIGNKQSKPAAEYIAKAEELMETILLLEPENATVHAFRSAFIGYKIGLSPYKAPFLGSKSIASIERALELDPDNIQAHIENGNSLFYRPGIFGGDKNMAIIEYEKAAALFESQNKTANNWKYLNLLTTLAQAYEAIGKPEKAQWLCEKILRMETDFTWVRDELCTRQNH